MTGSGPSTGGRARLIVITVVVTLLVVAIVAVPIAAMHRSDLPFERAYGSFMVSLVSRIGGGNATDPLGRTAVTEQGRVAYAGSCAVCHGARGDGKGVFGTAGYPPASDLLSEDAKEKSDAQLFWITKNGISFTGMPAFGGQYADRDIWALVSYIRALQQGRGSSLDVPAATAAQLAMADPHGTPVQRGAAVYFAQGCGLCHGAVGNAPGDLGLEREGETEAIRYGRRGMPAYETAQLSNADLRALQAYMRTFTGRGREGDD